MGVVLGQNLGQITSNVVKKSKETGITYSFFSDFAQGIHFKGRQEVVVVQTPEWKLRQIYTRVGLVMLEYN